MPLSDMALLKNPWHETPPGGFIVSIPAAKSSSQFWSFGEAISWYSGIARANPTLGLHTDPAAIANFISQQNALRILTMPGSESYITKGGPVQTLETKKVSLLKPVVAVADKMRQLSAGADSVAQWFLEGSPVVPQGTANSRAAICATCPQNGKGDFSRWFTVPASRAIQNHVERAKGLNLKTSHDDQLGVCEACLCPLKLKVHFPVELILEHLTEKARADLDPRCWITK